MPDALLERVQKLEQEVTRLEHDAGKQIAKLKTLNEIVKIAPPPDAADPTSSVITVRFDTWYPGNVTPQKDLVVPLWNTNAPRRIVVPFQSGITLVSPMRLTRAGVPAKRWR